MEEASEEVSLSLGGWERPESTGRFPAPWQCTPGGLLVKLKKSQQKVICPHKSGLPPPVLSLPRATYTLAPMKRLGERNITEEKAMKQ